MRTSMVHCMKWKYGRAKILTRHNGTAAASKLIPPQGKYESCWARWSESRSKRSYQKPSGTSGTWGKSPPWYLHTDPALQAQTKLTAPLEHKWCSTESLREWLYFHYVCVKDTESILTPYYCICTIILLQQRCTTMHLRVENIQWVH